MLHLTASKISVSLWFFNWIKNEKSLQHLFRDTIKKIISLQEQETNWNFTGCQVPHFMIVLIPYINLSSFFDNKMSIFKEYRAFNPKCNALVDIQNQCAIHGCSVDLRMRNFLVSFTQLSWCDMQNNIENFLMERPRYVYRTRIWSNNVWFIYLKMYLFLH